MFSHGMFSHGMFSHGMFSHGMFSHGMFSHGMFSHGMFSHGMIHNAGDTRRYAILYAIRAGLRCKDCPVRREQAILVADAAPEIMPLIQPGWQNL